MFNRVWNDTRNAEDAGRVYNKGVNHDHSNYNLLNIVTSASFGFSEGMKRDMASIGETYNQLKKTLCDH